MTTEEKLKHFQEICMTDAREKSARMLDDCVRALDAAFEEHKAEAERRAAMQEEAQKEKLEREKNKKLSIGQLDLKREISHRQEELKDKLFVEYFRITFRPPAAPTVITIFFPSKCVSKRSFRDFATAALTSAYPQLLLVYP